MLLYKMVGDDVVACRPVGHGITGFFFVFLVKRNLKLIML